VAEGRYPQIAATRDLEILLRCPTLNRRSQTRSRRHKADVGSAVVLGEVREFMSVKQFCRLFSIGRSTG